MSLQAPVLIVRRDTRAWRMQVWISFAVAVTLCAVGLARLPGADLDRAFMVMGYVFFDQVLVNDSDAALRANRFALLGGLRALFTRIADLSRLPG